MNKLMKGLFMHRASQL